METGGGRDSVPHSTPSYYLETIQAGEIAMEYFTTIQKYIFGDFLNIGKLSQYNVEQAGEIANHCLFIFTEENSEKYTKLLKHWLFDIVDLWAKNN